LKENPKGKKVRILGWSLKIIVNHASSLAINKSIISYWEFL
jgi:hypothetical protein